jgi:hypothetical protein
MSLAAAGYDCFKAFVALKLHFNTDTYDIHQQKGRLRITPDAYSKRQDYFLFERLVKRHPNDYKKLLLANFAYANVGHITEVSDERLDEWVRRRQSLSYLFKQDLEKITAHTLEQSFKIGTGHPELFRLFLGNKIMIETVALLEHEHQFLSKWNVAMETDFIWKSIGRHLIKFRGFIAPRTEMVRKVSSSIFMEV